MLKEKADWMLGLQAMQDGQGIVIDLDFEKQMTETEIKSLCGQLQYCYSSNTRSAVPCHLYFTSLQVSWSLFIRSLHPAPTCMLCHSTD